MYESETFDALMLEDKWENHINTLNKSALQQYKLSLRSSGSNVASNILLDDVWAANKELYQQDRMLPLVIVHVSNKLIGKSMENHQRNKWATSLSKFTDPVTLFEQSLPKCVNCAKSEPKKFEGFLKTECKCDLGSGDSANQKEVVKTKSILETNLQNQKTTACVQPALNSLRNLNSDHSSYETKFADDQKPFKPKFVQHKSTNSLPSTSRDTPVPDEMDLDKEEAENKAHKSKIAKITFKTAKETLLASNPAAKRTLGASRKAQGKFVSPMMGALDKQESTEPSTETDERLKHIDPKMIELIESEIIDKGNPVAWEDIAGLQMAKSVIQEAVVWPLLRPDIFTGLRRPPKGILLFGPPGTGKTLIGKCVAAQCNATFFSISASSLTSKWIGDGEKMVRALFAVARCHQPAVIFIDEIDSLLTQRSDTEHEATRRIKTEFLVQFDGASTGDEDRLLIIGATNRPQELDEAARRRLVKRLYIPLPDVEAREQIIANLLSNENNELSPQEVSEVARLTAGYSGADMRSLCSEAAMGPVRAVPISHIGTIRRDQVRPVCIQDFKNALQRVRPSVSQDDLGQYVKWNQTYGQGF